MKVILKQFLHLLFNLARNDSNRRISISSCASSVITRVLSSHRMTILPLRRKEVGTSLFLIDLRNYNNARNSRLRSLVGDEVHLHCRFAR